MAERPVGRVALMSVRPEFAEAILSGAKTVEFRKRPIALDVTHVVIYATQPIGAVVGVFEVAGQTTATPHELWARFSNVAGISEERFFAYYEDALVGTGIRVQRVHATPDRPTLQSSLGVARAPQSFQYVDGPLTIRAFAPYMRREGLAAARPQA